jgi:hypothetical protein
MNHIPATLLFEKLTTFQAVGLGLVLLAFVALVTYLDLRG